MKYYSSPDQILAQDTLRMVESLCTQEEPAACNGACPIHLDIKSIISHIQSGNLTAAYQQYSKAIPFPRIISSTCTAPCQDRCKRISCGGAVQIQKLEKHLITNQAREAKAPLFLPKKTGHIGIVGSSVRGMACAYDLVKKGYKVTVYESENQLGGHIRSYIGSHLTEEDIDKDFDAVIKLKAVFKTEHIDCKTEKSILDFKIREGLDAIYIACDCAIPTDSNTMLAKNIEKVLSGHRTGSRDDGYSSIYELYDGKSAALSIDRIMQGVSVMAGREKEGSYETKLFTNLEDVKTLPPVSADGDFTEDEARAEAERCIQCECMECVKKCAFMQKYKAYPGRYVREVYNNLSIPLGTHHANKMINTCALCGRCEAVCPNGFDMKSVFLAARQRMENTEKMPPSAFEFAILDMEYSMSYKAYLAKSDTDTPRYLFFPGCQLTASEPELTLKVYKDLRSRCEGGAGLLLSCCGVMANWAGKKSDFDAALDKIRREWENLGKPQIVTGCPSCEKTLVEDGGMDVISVWNLLEEIGLPESGSRPEGIKKLRLHHACGARHNPKLRSVVGKIAGDFGAEMTDSENDEQSPCCGYGGLVPFSNESVADDITDQTLSEIGGDDIQILTYCVNCRDRYLKKGTEACHMLELVYGRGSHRYPTWSQRQENRMELKNKALSEIWGEEIHITPGIKLTLDTGVEEKMESLKILRSDLAEAIVNAENTGDKFIKTSGNSLTSYRPANVTFWVEYRQDGDGWIVLNTYMHRMSAELTYKNRGV